MGKGGRRIANQTLHEKGALVGLVAHPGCSSVAPARRVAIVSELS
jgi:hypothetical protein